MLLKFKFFSHSNYLAKRVNSIAKFSNIKIKIAIKERFLIVEVDENSKNFENFTKNLDKFLYNSIFLEGFEFEKENLEDESNIKDLPLSIGVCNRCVNEMVDSDSRRYFYPFTGCSSCSNHYAFFDKYPFERKNSYLAVFNPCTSCQEELKNNPFREDYHLISCVDCNIPIRVVNKNEKKEFWVNKKDEYKRAFEMIASAIRKGEVVAIKTLFGFKSFFKAPTKNSRVLITNIEKTKRDFLLLKQEINSLFSIERPIIYATTTNEDLKRINPVMELKAFDDGFTLLLTKELFDLGYIFYEDGYKEYDLKMEFLLNVNSLKDIKLFINKRYKLLSEGERVLIPKYLPIKKVAIYKDYVLNEEVLDKVDRFETISADRVYIFEDENIEHSNIKKVDRPGSAFLSVLNEHNITKRSVGVYFGEEKQFLYFDGSMIKKVFDFKKEPKKIVENIKLLRDGSDRLVKNYTKKFGSLEKFETLDSFFKRVAYLIGIDGGFDELNRIALGFGGKGGVSIDCLIIDNRFSYESFYASIMSYKLADVDPVLLSYSIFESLGDFLSNTLNDISKKLKTDEFVIVGKYITNSALFSRFTRNIPKVLTNKEFSVDDLNLFYSLKD